MSYLSAGLPRDVRRVPKLASMCSLALALASLLLFPACALSLFLSFSLLNLPSSSWTVIQGSRRRRKSTQFQISLTQLSVILLSLLLCVCCNSGSSSGVDHDEANECGARAKPTRAPTKQPERKRIRKPTSIIFSNWQTKREFVKGLFFLSLLVSISQTNGRLVMMYRTERLRGKAAVATTTI